VAEEKAASLRALNRIALDALARISGEATGARERLAGGRRTGGAVADVAASGSGAGVGRGDRAAPVSGAARARRLRARVGRARSAETLKDLAGAAAVERRGNAARSGGKAAGSRRRRRRELHGQLRPRSRLRVLARVEAVGGRRRGLFADQDPAEV